MEAVRNLGSQLYNKLPDLNQEHHHRVQEQIGKQLSADQVQNHPEFQHVNWDLPYEKRELIDVAAGRGGPFKLAYELHGRGPSKIVVRSQIRNVRQRCSKQHIWLTHRISVDHGPWRLYESMAATD